MFGNSKEYQDLKKLYEEKVSKPEQIDEGLGDFIKQGGVAGAINRSMQKNEPIKKLRTAVSNIKIGSSTDGDFKVKPFKGLAPKTPIGANKDTSNEIEDSRKEFDANDGKKFNQRFKDANTDTSKEIESDANYAKSNLRFNRASKGLPPVKRPRVPSPMDMLNPGGVRVKARFKAREAQGLSGLTGKPKFEAYDVVLDYVLSEGHADTVKEAHYVMMQMDAETIQDIVERVILTEKPGDGYIGPKFLNIKNPIAKQRTNFQLDQNLKRLSKTGDSPEARDMLNIPQDFKITPEMKTKYGF